MATSITATITFLCLFLPFIELEIQRAKLSAVARASRSGASTPRTFCNLALFVKIYTFRLFLKRFAFLDPRVGTTDRGAEVTRLDARIRGADLWAPVHRGYPRDDDMAAGSATRTRPKLIMPVNSHRFPNWAPGPKT